MIVFVGVKRGTQPPADWPMVLETIAGVHLIGMDLPHLARLETDDTGLVALRERFGGVCTIEQSIEHRRQ